MSTRRNSVFSKKALVVGLALLLVMGILSGLLLFEGPRIRRVEYDPTTLTRQSNQTIVLRSNQPLQSIDKSQVTIEPQIDYSVNSSGESVILQLKSQLAYQTDYKITLRDIASRSGKKSTFSTTIQTAPAEYYFLKRKAGTRADKESDAIVKGSLNGAEETVYSAHKIIDFGLLGDSLVVAHLTQDGTYAVTLYDLKKQTSKDIALPEKGSVGSLAASPNKNLFGFTFTSDIKSIKKTYDHALLIYDIKAGVLVPVKGIGTDKLSVTNWKFHPDGTSLVAQSYSSGVLLIDSYSKHSPVPLGTYYSIGNFSRDGSRVVLSDPAKGPVIFNLQDKTRTLPVAKPFNGTEPSVIDMRLLQNSNGMLKALHVVGGQTYSRVFLIGAGEDDRVLYAVDSKQAQTYDYKFSSNDQYLALELSEAQGRQLDTYPETPRPTNLKTNILRSKDGSLVKTIDGFRLTWW